MTWCISQHLVWSACQDQGCLVCFSVGVCLGGGWLRVYLSVCLGSGWLGLCLRDVRLVCVRFKVNICLGSRWLGICLGISCVSPDWVCLCVFVSHLCEFICGFVFVSHQFGFVWVSHLAGFVWVSVFVSCLCGFIFVSHLCGCVCVVVSHLFGFVCVSLCLTCVGLSGCLSFVSHLCGSFVSHLCGFVCQLECLTWREAGAIWCHPPAKTFDSLCLSLLLFSCSCHLLSWSAVCLLAHRNVCRCFFLFLPLFSILFGTAALVLLDGVAFWFYFCWFGLCVDTTPSSSSSSSSFLSLPPLHFFSFFLLFNSFTALKTWHRRKNATHLYCSMCTSSYL